MLSPRLCMLYVIRKDPSVHECQKYGPVLAGALLNKLVWLKSIIFTANQVDNVKSNPKSNVFRLLKSNIWDAVPNMYGNTFSLRI